MKLPLILLLVASAAKQAIAEAGNHFYTTNPNGEGIGADEYHLEGPACWVCIILCVSLQRHRSSHLTI